jgi:DNA-binding MarR family transcriptional regulator
MLSTLKKQGYDFPSSCIGILADLWSKDGQQQKELGTSLIKTKSSINKMLAILIEEDLIVKKGVNSDKRSKYIFLTQKGKDLRKIVDEHHTCVNNKLLQNFTKEEIQLSKKVLSECYDFLIKNENEQSINDK